MDLANVHDTLCQGAGMLEFSILSAILGSLVLLLSLFSVPIDEATYVSKPMFAVLIGILIGPHGAAWLDPGTWDVNSLTVIEIASKLTIGIALMGAGIRLPRGFLLRNRKNMLLILGPLMLLMWASSSALVTMFFSFPLWLILLLGAMLTPTDPILIASIVEGERAEKSLPRHLREILSAESGANDGFAYPMVMLPILMHEAKSEPFLLNWFLKYGLWNIGGGIVCGLLAGMALGRAFVYAEKSRFVDQSVLFGTTLALSLLLIGLEELISINGLIAIFFAGRGFDRMARPDAACKEAIIQDATNQFFSVPIFALFGVMIPFDEWQKLGVSGLILTVSILLLRRMPWTLLLKPWLSTLQTRREALIMGWFGPMGAAALYYASFASTRSGTSLPWTLGSLVVTGSILAHGMTTMPISRLLATRNKSMTKPYQQREKYGIKQSAERIS